MPPRLVTAAIIRKEGQLLITRRPEEGRHGGMGEFPGGKLDENESPQEGIRREILEELGIEVAVGPIFETASFPYPWGPVLILAFECSPLSGPIRNLQVAEHRWILPTEIRELRHPLRRSPYSAKTYRRLRVPPTAKNSPVFCQRKNHYILPRFCVLE